MTGNHFEVTVVNLLITTLAKLQATNAILIDYIGDKDPARKERLWQDHHAITEGIIRTLREATEEPQTTQEPIEPTDPIDPAAIIFPPGNLN